MTKYEVSALVLSVVAIVIPIVQWIWRTWIIKPVLRFYPTGRAYLFINKSGSYMRIDGVYEALRKPISIKSASVLVKRKKDGAALNLQWSSFLNPANQQIMGAIASASEIAHPFRIDANNVCCAFTEYADFFNSSYKTLQPYFDRLQSDIGSIMRLVGEGAQYLDVCREYRELPSYKAAREAMFKEFFWEIGKYEIILTVCYNAREKKEFRYAFEVSGETRNLLVQNIGIIMESILNDYMRRTYTFNPVQVEVTESAE